MTAAREQSWLKIRTRRSCSIGRSWRDRSGWLERWEKFHRKNLKRTLRAGLEGAAWPPGFHNKANPFETGQSWSKDGWKLRKAMPRRRYHALRTGVDMFSPRNGLSSGKEGL